MPGILYIYYIANRCGVQTWILKIRLGEDRADGEQPVSEAKKKRRKEQRKRVKEKESGRERDYRKHKSKTEGTGVARG